MIRAVCTKFSRDKLKKKYHTVGAIPKSNWKIVDTDAKSMHITHIYMTAQFPGLVKFFHKKGRNIWLLLHFVSAAW